MRDDLYKGFHFEIEGDNDDDDRMMVKENMKYQYINFIGRVCHLFMLVLVRKIKYHSITQKRRFFDPEL